MRLILSLLAALHAVKGHEEGCPTHLVEKILEDTQNAVDFQHTREHLEELLHKIVTRCPSAIAPEETTSSVSQVVRIAAGEEDHAHAECGARKIGLEDLLGEHNLALASTQNPSVQNIYNAMTEFLTCLADPECKIHVDHAHEGEEHHEEDEHLHEEGEHDDEHEDEHEEEDRPSDKLKGGMLLVIFGMSLIGLLLPFIMVHIPFLAHMGGYFNAYSGGIFLTTGLTHIFMDAAESQFAISEQVGDYPILPLIAVLTFYALLCMERVLLHAHAHVPVSVEEPHGKKRGCTPDANKHHHEHSHSHHEHSHAHVIDVEKAGSSYQRDSTEEETTSSVSRRNSKDGADLETSSSSDRLVARVAKSSLRLRKAILISAAIGIHSIISGLGLGIATTYDAFWAIFAAIAAHKLFDGFVVGTQALKGKSSWLELLIVGAPSILAEPVGIIIGMNIPSESEWTKGVLMALVAGCFIYIGATEVPMDEFETQEHTSCSKDGELVRTHNSPSLKVRILKFLAMMLGVTTMALTNIALAKGHGAAHGGHAEEEGGGDAHNHRRRRFY